jgi:hypothetical protein
MASYRSFAVICHNELNLPQDIGTLPLEKEKYETVIVPGGNPEEAIQFALLEHDTKYYTPICYTRSDNTDSFLKERITYEINDLTGEFKPVKKERITIKRKRTRQL